MKLGKGAGVLGTLSVTAVILLVMVFVITVLGGSLLKFLGMEYESFRAVFLFFVVYFMVDLPVDLLVEALPMALRELGRIRKGWMETLLYIAVDIPVNCAVMAAIDFFMDSVRMPVSAVLVFSVVLCALNLFMSRRKKGDAVRVYVWEQKPGESMESRELLREALGLYCEEKYPGLAPENLELLEGPHGKPCAARSMGADRPPLALDDLHFSVSHTPGWWLCAVYSAPLGVDIEERGRRVNLEVGGRFFSRDEQRWLETAGADQEHFLELWVRKEAYVKYLGTGLAEGMSRFSAAGPASAPQSSEEGENTEYSLLEWIGADEKKAYCQSLFSADVRDPDGFPLPLVGAICLEDVPAGIEIGFMERGEGTAAEDDSETGGGDEIGCKKERGKTD